MPSRSRPLAVAFAFLLTCSAAFAQDRPALPPLPAHPEGPATQPADAAGPRKGPPRPTKVPDRIISNIRIQNAPLDEVLDFLRESDPNFQFVVVYEPGAETDRPVISDLVLAQATAGQVVEALALALPQISVQRQDGWENLALWTVRVQPPRSEQRFIFREPPPVTRIYRLREYIDEFEIETNPDPGGPKSGPFRVKARDAILALIETALRTSAGDDAMPVIRLHEPTETLIVRGSKDQAELVENALSAMRPPRPPRPAPPAPPPPPAQPGQPQPAPPAPQPQPTSPGK